MPLTCDWGATPAYTDYLQPAYDAINAAADGSPNWSSPKIWDGYSPLLPLLDSLVTGAGCPFYPPIAGILMGIDQGSITPDNAAEVWGRMRAVEELTGDNLVTCWGAYDPDTDTYNVDGKDRPLSRPLFDLCMGYKANVATRSRTTWIRNARKYGSLGKYTARHINDTVAKHAAAYEEGTA